MVKKRQNKKEKKKVEVKDRLSKEQYLEMRNYHLQMDMAKQELRTLGLEISDLEKAKQLATLRRNDNRVKVARIETEYNIFLDKLLKDGLDIRKKTIDTETFKILD